MSSLKGYIPALARLLGTTPAALYERQRALVRDGLLEAAEGRGPGSGVRLDDDEAVALLLLSVLATDRLSESTERVRALSVCKPTKRQCPHTGASTFGRALATLLYSTGKASDTVEVSVSRTADRAHIRYLDRHARHAAPLECEFLGKRLEEPPISASASIGVGVLSKIADDVQAMVMEAMENGEK